MASTTPIAPGLQRKLRKVLDTRSEAPEISNSLSTLSTFYTENTTTTRRHLRSTIENESLQVNQEFLTAAEGVIAALDAIQLDLDKVSQFCDRMTTSIVENKSSTAGLLLETDRLEKSLQTSHNRSRLLQQFLDQYQLSQAESDALQSDTITDTFFKALEHVQNIHANCKSLLRTHHQRAGLELLDTMSAYQESAYEKLCRWVQSECRTFSDVDFPEASPLLQHAVKALAARPVLYKYCGEEVASARQTALFQRFISALTRGTRPIEMHAPDPWRFASDMLAWVHTALASEREFLVSLFGDGVQDKSMAMIDDGSSGGNNGSGSGSGSGVDDKNNNTSTDQNTINTTTSSIVTLSKLLDTTFEGICRPLRVRIEQILMTTPPPLLCFKLSQLLTFYLHTIDSMLGFSSQLSDTLRACRAMAMRTFHEHLKHKGEKLGRFPPPPPLDLSLPVQLAEGAVLAEEVIKSYEGSMLSTNTTSGIDNTTTTNNNTSTVVGVMDDPLDMDTVLSAIITPLITAAQHSAEALDPNATARLDDGSHLDPTAQKIYIINCVYTLQRSLEGHSCASKQLDVLKKMAQIEIEGLAAIEAQRVLSSSGLDTIATKINNNTINDNNVSLSSIARSMQTFFGSLTDPSSLPEFRKLQAPILKAEAVRRSLTSLADAYTCVYEYVNDERNGFNKQEVMQLIRHTPAQVKTLLGISTA